MSPTPTAKNIDHGHILAVIGDLKNHATTDICSTEKRGHYLELLEIIRKFVVGAPYTREPVSDFSVAMESVLTEHDAAKGAEGWKGMSIYGLGTCLYTAYLKLDCPHPSDRMARQAIDVANLCMMLWDNNGRPHGGGA